MSLDATRTVRELAIEVPNATRVFEKLGIDYCCGGTKSLSDACQHAHIALENVLSELEQGAKTEDSPRPDFENGSLGQLIEHIVGHHHSYVKQELPRIQQLLK